MAEETVVGNLGGRMLLAKFSMYLQNISSVMIKMWVIHLHSTLQIVAHILRKKSFLYLLRQPASL